MAEGDEVGLTLDVQMRKGGLPPERMQDPFRSAQNGSDSSRLGCSVGIMAYNEEDNIVHAIETVLGQQLLWGEIDELIIVASGCTDRTAEIVASLAREDQRVRLITQETRAGKASAINLFIDAARSPVLVLVSADVMLEDGTIDALMEHFHVPAIGMVGGHPIPVNDSETFLGHAVHLLWHLHDQIARESPKCGEIVAFRNIIPQIPSDTAVDEISIQALIAQFGYRIEYEPRAIVYNRGPTTIGDYLLQRRRIAAGHLKVAKQQGYAASTMDVRRIGYALLKTDSFTSPRSSLWTLGTVALEATARALGYFDLRRHRSHHIWAPVTTTKRDITEDLAQGDQHVLIFHLVDFTPSQLERGTRVTPASVRRVARHIESCLGPSTSVSEQKNGTIIAILYGDRSKAEEAAQSVVEGLATSSLDSHRQRKGVQVACGIITFPRVGHPLAGSIPAAAG